jgi:peptidoglycan hydrolase-like protein with peptidoglycan-binding domain
MAVTRVVKKKVSHGGGASKAQKEWMSKLGEFAGAGGGDETDGEEKQKRRRLTDEQRAELERAVKKGIIPSIPGIPGGEIPGKIIDKLFGVRSAVVRIANNTGQTLRLDPLSLREVKDTKKIGISDGSRYNSLPPDPIGPNKPAEIIVSAQDTAGLSLRGAEARIRYFIDDQKTAWIIHFDNSPMTKSVADVLLDGPNKAQYKSPKPVVNDAKKSVFAFTLNGGGGGKGPGGGGSGTDVSSNCIVTVNNKTDQELTLVDQGHDRGDFMTFPPSTLPPGGSGQFVSIETPNSKDQGCKGFIEWEVGSPATATCRMEWDNPERKKNTTKTKVDPSNAGFKVLDQIGQGEENVPVAFTISGGGGSGPGGKEPEFLPPPQSKQPTLRKGDKSQDGWVEYLQFRLNIRLGTTLPRDGKFDTKVRNAVIKLQKKDKLMVDGIVGNQTWAALRFDKPEPPSTDGRKPHTFVERGVEARWSSETKNTNRYFSETDVFQLAVDSVGDTEIKKAIATIRVTAPGTKSKVKTFPLGPAQKGRGQARTGTVNSLHIVTVKDFRKEFPSADPMAKVTDYLVEAYLPKELGGDFYSAKVREA